MDNQTLEGEPAPNAELAWELRQSMEERLRGAHWISVAIGLRWVSPPPL